ncbi:hypothetical protein NED98_17295 [Sphingomonas sp. MMSM20]|uniref:hypothetical protein n=1 Tax=Sphingomonas lycopersici TaxID=2951807 RepID=UPI002238BC27|nr:hypothetical protein [Sphingomonas lycopersici]MCW6532006.1 hypothetical protein [Sphingomonas lycopersici]
MSEFARPVPVWFRIVAILLVLWGAMGVFACVQQFRLGAEAMGQTSAYDRALYASLPAWYNWVYALAVGSGLLGALALLFRRAVARPLFVISLAAIVVQFGYLFAATDIIATKGIWVTYFPLFIFAVALIEVRLAGVAIRNRWAR